MHLAHGQNIASTHSLVQICSHHEAATELQQQDVEEALKSQGKGLGARRQEATWVLDDLDVPYTPLPNITVLKTQTAITHH